MENWHTKNKEKGLCPDCGAVKENPESYCCDKCKAYHHNYYVESKEFFIFMDLMQRLLEESMLIVNQNFFL